MSVKPLPKITQPGMVGYLAWMRRDQPKLYAAMAKDIPAVALFERTLQQQFNNLGDFDIGDALSSVGDTIASSAGDVASWLGTNAPSLIKAAGAAYVSTQQVKLAQTQLAVARTNSPPMQTGYVTNQYGQTYIAPIQPTQNPAATIQYANVPSGNSVSTYGIPPYGQPSYTPGYSVPSGYAPSAPEIIPGVPNVALYIGGGVLLLLLLTR